MRKFKPNSQTAFPGKKVIATSLQKNYLILFVVQQIFFYFAAVILIGVLNN
jgi:hypothetical protein